LADEEIRNPFYMAIRCAACLDYRITCVTVPTTSDGAVRLSVPRL
jgi:hypothetical protein